MGGLATEAAKGGSTFAPRQRIAARRRRGLDGESAERLFPLIDTVILLSAPVETIMERLAARSPGSYGNTAEDRQKVGELVSTIEPLLRGSAHHEIDTRGLVADKVDEILRVV